MKPRMTRFVLFTKPGDVAQSCGIIVEPVSRSRRVFPESIEVCLKAVLHGLDASLLLQTYTESWVLQSSSGNNLGTSALQHLLMELSARGLHMVRIANITLLFC